MKVTILCNDISKEGFLAEHGLSLLIDEETLFDTGQINATYENAKRLNVDFSKIERIFISHGHYDHIGGLTRIIKYMNKPKLYIYRKALVPKYSGKKYVGFSGDWTEIERLAEIVFIDHQTHIDGFEIISKMNTDVSIIDDKFTVGEEKDTFDDELNLFKDGVLFTGCAHRGVEYIFQEALNRGYDVRAIVGGFHLIDASQERIVKIAELFKKHNVKVIPLHCSGERATEVFKSYLGNNCLICKAGDSFELF